MMLGARRCAAAGLVVAIALALTGTARAALVHEFDFGAPGTAGGQLGDPGPTAVDYATGHVYVTEAGNNRVSEFSPDGAFIRAWGFDVVAAGKPNDKGTAFEVCDTTAGNVAADCTAGQSNGSSGAFNDPEGIAVDNSCALHDPPLTGADCSAFDPAAGDVYVQDSHNLRVQRFHPDGQFVLMWGKGVDADSGGDICPRPGSPADLCQPGGVSSTPTGFDGGASENGWLLLGVHSNRIATDFEGNVYTTSGRAEISAGCFQFPGDARVVKFSPSGEVLGWIHERADGNHVAVSEPQSIALDGGGNLYVQDPSPVCARVPKKFPPTAFTPTGVAQASGALVPHIGVEGQTVAVDPSNGYLFVKDVALLSPCQTVTGSAQDHLVEYTPGGEVADCSPPTTPGMELLGAFGGPGAGNPPIEAFSISLEHRLYMTVGSQIRVFATPVAGLPSVDGQTASKVTTTSALLAAQVNANLSSATYRIEYGPTPCSDVPDPCQATPEMAAGASLSPKPQSFQVNELDPDTTYFYRIVVTNAVGQTAGPDRSFHTFQSLVFDPSCSNNLARQQTGAGFLLDCRAYELVSARDSGGYDVESTLVAGQTPFGGYPSADGRALYGVHDGIIPNSGTPTNRGVDPYLATRDAADQRWNTTYVGIPADVRSSAPFASTLFEADGGLNNFAFGGSDLCDPCFPDGSSGIPIHSSDGSLQQGMVGSLPVPLPVPSGIVEKRLSANGAHLVFGSTQQFDPQGNSGGSDVTIYDRNLDSGTTQVVSTDQNGSTIANGGGVAELDISADGSHILIGKRVSTDAAGNAYYDLYMHVGNSPKSVQVADTPSGVLFAGMTEDGSRVYFTTRDQLSSDIDSSTDLFRATLGGGVVVERVSTGAAGTGDTDSCDPTANSARAHWNTVGSAANCDVVAIGGGGGVASRSGSVYFLSPERLDTSDPQNLPIQDHPNLYVARPGFPPRFVATLESALDFGSFSKATGVAVEEASGDVYVLDIGNAGKGVKKFDDSGNPVDFTAGQGAGTNKLSGADAPCTAFSFNPIQGLPTELAVDQSTGSLYVPDLLKGKVDVFSAAGDCLSQIGVASPSGVAVNPVTHNVYVSSGTGGSSAVKVFTPAGALVTSFSVSANSVGPKGLAVDADGKIYVVNNTRTAVYDPSGAFLRVLDPNPSFGVAVEPGGDVLVDEGNQFVRYDPHGALLGEPVGAEALSGSVGIAAGSGETYVSNGAGTAVAHFDSQGRRRQARDSALVLDSVGAAAVRDRGQFQTTPDGAYAAFPSTLPLTGSASLDHSQVFLYDRQAGSTRCASCSVTGEEPSSDATLAPDGLSITDDGRLLFDTGEDLSLRDTNQRRDVYEWSPRLSGAFPGACASPGGCLELVSTGSGRADSRLLSVTDDGTDAFFFTRERLDAGDENGNTVKLYDARAGGGFFSIPPQPQCKASDECHGAGSPAPPAPSIATVTGDGGNLPAPAPVKRCPKGRHKVLRKGKTKCVRPRRRHTGGRR